MEHDFSPCDCTFLTCPKALATMSDVGQCEPSLYSLCCGRSEVFPQGAIRKASSHSRPFPNLLQSFSSGSAKSVSSSVAFANGLFGYAPPTQFISRIDSTVEYFFGYELFEVNFNDACQQVFPNHDFWNGAASARQLPNE